MSEYIVDLTDVEKRKFSWSMETLYEQVPVREEIVRCRDCKHLMSNNRCNLQDDYNEFHWLDVEPDGFCAWGERKVDA